MKISLAGWAPIRKTAQGVSRNSNGDPQNPKTKVLPIFSLSLVSDDACNYDGDDQSEELLIVTDGEKWEEIQGLTGTFHFNGESRTFGGDMKTIMHILMGHLSSPVEEVQKLLNKAVGKELVIYCEN